MNPRLFLILLLSIVVACNKTTTPPPDSNSTPADNRSPAPVSPPSQVPPVTATEDPDAAALGTVVGELTQVVRRYGAEQRRVPQSLEELVQNGYLTQIPAAPPGKRFTIGRNLQVQVVDE